MRSKPELWEYAPVERAQCPDPLLLAACTLSGDATVATLRALASTNMCKPAVHLAVTSYHLGHHRLHRATFNHLRVWRV
jgi:hypothetical protein